MEQQEKPNDTSAFFWKREITLGQFAGLLVTILMAGTIAVWNQSKTITEQGMRITVLERNMAEIPQTLREITSEQRENNKETQAKMELILIKLENKKDR